MSVLPRTEWSTPTGRELIAQGVKIETDMLICDKRALVPLSLEESALVPKERIVPSRMVLVEKCDDEGNRFVKARLTAKGDQDPELLSFLSGTNKRVLRRFQRTAKWLLCRT